MLTRLSLLAAMALPLQIAFWLFGSSMSSLGYSLVNPIRAGDIELSPASTSLGRLKLGEARSVEVRVINRKDRSIVLQPPLSPCGCLRARLDCRQLLAHQSTTLRFDYRAPFTPGTQSKRVVLRADGSDVTWRLPVTCTVSATAWCQPARLSITLDQEGRGHARGVIKLQKNVELGSVASDSELLDAKLLERSGNKRQFEVLVKADEAGQADLIFRFLDQQSPLRVPIAWRPAQRIVCHPRRILLKPTPSREEYCVTVISDAQRVSDLDILPVVHWVELVKRETLNCRVTKFSLRITGNNIPPSFHGPIVDVVGAGTSHRAHLFGKVSS